MKCGWQQRRLGELLHKVETVNPLRAPEMEFDYIDVSSVSNTTFRIEETQRLKGREAPSRARRLVRVNDVLFATIRPTLRRIAVVPDSLDGQVCSTGYIVLRPTPGIDHRFLFYALFSEDFTEQMELLQKGASYPAVTDSEVRAQTVPVPPLAEQQRIVAILDEAFADIAVAKANAEKNLRNARALFESHLESAFTNPGDGWGERRLNEVARDFGRGKSKHRPRNDPRLYGGRYPFVQTGDVRHSQHRIEAYSQTYSEAGLAQSKLWPAGTLCITIAANIAETGILTFDACFPDSVIGVVADETQTSGRFLEYMLQSFKVHLQALGKGSAQANINLATFANQVFPFPGLDTQAEIVETLDLLDSETQRLESVYQRKLTALYELKRSLLQQAFSGQL